MVENVRGIVIRTVKYGDSSLIVDMFTEGHGRMSFMTNISRGRRVSNTSSCWQPLSMVEFQADIRPLGKMPKPKDIHSYYVYHSLPYSPIKSTVALFVAEFLSAALREEKTNEPLFMYLESSLQWLDMVQSNAAIANFHVAFLIHLSHFIGIYPNVDPNSVDWKVQITATGNTSGSSMLFFDLMAGTFCKAQPPHAHFLKPEEARFLPLLFRMDFSNAHLFRFSRSVRMRILHVLNDFYRLHVPSFPELKSLDVFKAMFD